ncbi:MAG: hypothetical protein PHX21_07780 [bacterium]|nr:hypothetical protein [bacterium]
MDISGIKNFSFTDKVDQKQVGEKFESMFVSILLKELHIPNLGIGLSGSDSNGSGIGETLEPVLRTEISDALCKDFNFGFRDILKLKNYLNTDDNTNSKLNKLI